MPPHRLGTVLYVCVAALFVAWCAQRDFARQGDGWEYLITTEALVRHGSADIRDADIAAVSGAIDAWVHARGGPAPAGAIRAVIDAELAHRFVLSPDGRQYAMHFWLYPLAAVPARVALAAAGWPVFNALVVTNAMLAAIAIWMVLFTGGNRMADRVALAATLAITPVLWYVAFTGVEVFCWAFVLLSLMALDRERPGLAAVLAGVAAAQNPPLVFLAFVPAGVAAARLDWRSSRRALAGASIALLPMAFYAWTVGTLSPLTRAHVDLGGVSVARTAGLLLDLDFGLLAYVPVLVLLLPIALVRLARTREPHRLLLLGALVATTLVAETQTNWNSAGMGLHRYAVWMLPMLTWIVLDGWSARGRVLVASAVVATSGAVLLVDAPDETNWLAHRHAAAWAMRAAPTWYHPEFEVFAERSAHAEAPPGWMIEGRRDGWTELLPVAHGHPSGEVTTLLVHAASAPRLQERFRVDGSYWPTLEALATAATSPVYVHPPAGAVWSREDLIDGTYQFGAVAAARVRVQAP